MIPGTRAWVDRRKDGSMERSSGVILHITSLESPYGIGTMGRCAYGFADFLKRAGQSFWQVLPLGPTGYGDSPYQSFSSFAGNPWLIDPELLAEEKLLTVKDLSRIPPPQDPSRVSYDTVRVHWDRLLRQAYRRRRPSHRIAQEAFLKENRDWLADYSLFMAIKEQYGGAAWQDWPDGARLREPKALERFRHELGEEMDYQGFVQYLFFAQWSALKAYVNSLGIRIIGDLPIYVAEDSADVWSAPGLFDLDAGLGVSGRAGVPPDYFSADGQLWGNPLYRWAAHAGTGFEWWLGRVGASLRVADVVRIDHFRGFWDYWSVPAAAATARKGRWMRGPGMDLVRALQKAYPDLPVIAEDLGLLSRGAMRFVRSSGYPGMKVLQFAFDASRPGRDAPHTFPVNSVCYTGTHDNTTLRGWLAEALPPDRALAARYLGLNETEGPARGLIRGGMACPSALFMAPMQDWLELDADARMNTPGTVGSNWRWRMTPGWQRPGLASEMAAITKIFGRSRRRSRNGKV